MMLPIIKLLRPHQYIKNGFVLVGVTFSHRWDKETLCAALLSFLAFCLMSSSLYIVNDVFDLKSDQNHPLKRHRPIASGAVNSRQAWMIAIILSVVALWLAFKASPLMPLFILMYLLLMIAYTLYLKHIVILDVFAISAGFMVRLLAGTYGLGFEASGWLILCGIMLTLFLGFSKRRAELLMLETTQADTVLTRSVLGDYSPVMLEQYISVAAACTILSYGLFAVSKETSAGHFSGNMIYTVPFVIYGIFRYLFLLHHRSQGSDAAYDLLTDTHMLFTVTCWGLVSILAIR